MEKVNAPNLKISRFNLALRTFYDHRILFPTHGSGMEVLLKELAMFPDDKHDDQVDSLCVVGAYMDRIIHKARRSAAGQTI